MPPYILEIAVVALGLVLLLLEAWTPAGQKHRIGYTALAGLLGVLLLLISGLANDVTALSPTLQSFYVADQLALYYKGLALIATCIVLIFALEYRTRLEKFAAIAGGGPALGEYYVLPVFICAGLMWMASAVDITSIFVSLELVTIAFYIHVAYLRRNVGSLEAGVKYLILGALSTGFFVYGLSWLFGVTGQTNLEKIGLALQLTNAPTPAYFALALILVGLAFKIAAVPFQIWVPDVYQGAPLPTTAYLSVASKAAGFLVAHRILQPFLASPQLGGTTSHILLVLAGATLLIGNLAALAQTNFKRLLAYSSIAHAGFLLLALATNAGAQSIEVVSFYLACYLVMTLLAFAVMLVISRATGSDELSAYNGLAQRQPFLAFALALAMASLAGVPLTAGFLGKFFVFTLAVGKANIPVIILAIIGAVAGFYYYFKVIRQMWFLPPSPDSANALDASVLTISPLLKALIILLMALTILLGVLPNIALNPLR